MSERYGACRTCGGTGKVEELRREETIESGASCRCSSCRDALPGTREGDLTQLARLDPDHWLIWHEHVTKKTTVRYHECLACMGTGHSGDAIQGGR